MIWIKIEKIDDNKESIYLPQEIIRHLPAQARLRFGLREMIADLYPADSYPSDKTNTFYKPVIVLCSESVINKLLINESPVYQMVNRGGILYIGPVIGLLLGEQSFYYHNGNMTGFTRGMKAYPQIGGLHIGFKDASIDWDNMLLNGLYFNYDKNSWEYGTCPLPSAVFRRAFKTQESNVERLRKLTGNRVFNSLRFNKWEIHKILEAENNYKQYLPDTERVDSIINIKKFIDKYSKVILKPAGLSRGRGICFIHKDAGNFKIYDYRDAKDPRFYFLSSDKLEAFISKGDFINRDYIIQYQLDLATINGSPFDIRVVMGKDEDENWHCRGIECRHAGSKNIITNISRGGQALSINNAIKLSFGPTLDSRKVKDDIIAIAKKFCSIMDRTGEFFAEFGLDFAVDKYGKYWFIEANVRPVFRGFKKLSYNNYLHIRHAPLLYAAYLAGFGREVKNSEPKL
jgi:hypothetical protein